MCCGKYAELLLRVVAASELVIDRGLLGSCTAVDSFGTVPGTVHAFVPHRHGILNWIGFTCAWAFPTLLRIPRASDSFATGRSTPPSNRSCIAGGRFTGTPFRCSSVAWPLSCCGIAAPVSVAMHLTTCSTHSVSAPTARVVQCSSING